MTLKQLTICTLKKSTSIFGEIGAGILLFGSTILASAISGLILAYFVREVANVSRVIVDVLSNPISVVIEFLTNITGTIASFFTISFFGIPLWAILFVPIAIVVYSFLWCVNRELTEEDYNSYVAHTITNMIILVTVFVILQQFFVNVLMLMTSNMYIGLYHVPQMPIEMACGMAIWGSGFITFVCWIDNLSTISARIRSINFIGAVYHHYFKVKK